MMKIRASVKRRKRTAIIAVLVAALASSAVGLALAVKSDSSEASRPSPAGDAWRNETLRDFSSMNAVLVNYLKVVEDWRQGKASDAAAAGLTRQALLEYGATRAALATRTPYPEAPRALEDYRASVALYIESARLTAIAAELPSGALKDQLKLSYARVRTLGDRIYDQADAELEPFVAVDSLLARYQSALPPAVPDFASMQLAPGPPLRASSKTAEPRSRQQARPEQPFGEWLTAVTEAAIPTAASEAAAIRTGSAEALAAMSEAFTGASAKLYSVPDPAGERPLSTRVQLALLVHAEAARAAEAATLAPDKWRTQLSAIAQALALVGDGLWDDRLGMRDTGFSASILQRAP